MDTKKDMYKALRMLLEPRIVLLKNRGGTALPLSLAVKTIAFIGPHHDATTAMQSSYTGASALVHSHSPLLAMQALAKKSGMAVTSSRGCSIGGSCTKAMASRLPSRQSCELVSNDTSEIAAAVAVAAAADVAVVFVGLNQEQESEWGNPNQNDRQFLELPGAQARPTSSPSPYFVPGPPHVIRIEWRQALISYQDYKCCCFAWADAAREGGRRQGQEDRRRTVHNPSSFRVPLCAAFTLNATGPSRVSLSLR